jgi:hypothetical protein
MTNNSRVGAVALIVGLALMLGACGSKASVTGTTETAQVTFQSEPVAEVWIDGKASGSTPLVVPLKAGTHEVSLKRAGFTDLTETVTVKAGTDITLDGALPVAGSDESALRRLIAMVGEKHEPLAKPTTHRGVGSAVTLYYPMGDVRREGLSTYRIEVDPSYDYEGYIEFRKGSKVLHREKFEPETMITEKALPAEVLEAARSGADLTWGLTYDNKRRKKDEMLAKFEIVSKSREQKINKSLEKLAKRKAYASASPLLQEMTEIEQLKRYRLYSEVLVRSLGVLNAWDDTELPYANMVDVMTRLKLKDSSLYQFVASKVSSGGGKRILDGGTAAVTNKDRSKGGGSAGGALGSSAAGNGMAQGTLPPVAVAPPSKRAGATGLKAGGLGVTPTDNGNRASKDPASIAGGESSASGNEGATQTGQAPRSGRSERAEQVSREIKVLKDELREADLKAARAADAEEAKAAIEADKQQAGVQIEEMGPKIEAAEQARDAAEQSLADLKAGGASAADIKAALKAAEDARAAASEAAHNADELTRQLRELEKSRDATGNDLDKILKETGSAGAAAAEAEKIRERIAEKEQQLENLSRRDGKGDNLGTAQPSGPAGTAGTPGVTDPNGALKPQDRKQGLEEMRALAQKDLAQAQEGFLVAETFRDDVAADLNRATQQRDDAVAALQAAEQALPSAKDDYDQKRQTHEDLVSGGAAQSEIDAAKAAMDAAEAAASAAEKAYQQAFAERESAEADAARAAIEQERANAAADRAKLELDAAQAAVEQGGVAPQDGK